MTSVITKYRLEHPEFREQERIKDNQRKKDKYANDEAYRQMKKEKAIAYYYKKKQMAKASRESSNDEASNSD